MEKEIWKDIPGYEEYYQNNNVSNLEWCTAQYNTNYGTCMQRCRLTQRHTNRNMKPVIAYNDIEVLEFSSIRGAARRLNLYQSNILHAIKRNIKCGKYYWKYK